MTSKVNQERREERAKQTAEVFTPPRLVKQMLDKLPKEVWNKGKTFCDPACGNGNFLIAVLWRKIARNHNPLDALKTIYGVDIMKDNIQECRLRLLKLVGLYEEVTKYHIQVVFTNIRYISKSKNPGGSLDYDFAFENNNQSLQNIERWLELVQKTRAEELQPPLS